MLSAGFPQRTENCLRRSSLLVSAVVGLIMVHFATSSAEISGFVYCMNRSGAQIFAGQHTANRKLKFGVSVWSPAGQNISVFGIASRHGRGWRYTENLGATTAAERCKLDIVRGRDGALIIAADQTATCQSQGGVNAEIGTVRFPPDAYEGPVKTELDDPEAFQRAGKCAGGRPRP